MFMSKVRNLSVRLLVFSFACAMALFFGTGTLPAQSDPGPRGGPAGAGGALPSLTPREKTFFTQALQAFLEVDSVSGTVPGEEGSGLGPTFNGNSCAMCHAQPTAGGSSPGLKSKQHAVPNPQVALATLHGARNTVPPFITADGPVREARFIAAGNRDSSPLDGGVHGLFTIEGRTDARGCQMDQPSFGQQLANKNVIFRIPTPVYGLGFVEATPDATLQANMAANQNVKAALGIGGKLNTSGNDGTMTRFGWKAQNKSLVIFAGEAYNVEQGVSNEVFMNERAATSGCVFNSSPEDFTRMSNPNNGTPTGTPGEMSSDTVNFAMFMRMLAAPTPTTSPGSEKNGQTLFSSVGCVLCHSDSLTTGSSKVTGMGGVTYHPYSDYAVHNMGSTLADGIVQGAAGPDEFRTAPLWGIGQRLFFLHDGRTSDLLEAIRAHASPGGDCVIYQSFQQFKVNGDVSQPFTSGRNCGSEANAVIARFNALTTSQRQDILNFLRSL